MSEHAWGVPRRPDELGRPPCPSGDTRLHRCTQCGILIERPAGEAPSVSRPCPGQLPHVLKHDRLRSELQWTAIGLSGRIGPDFETREQAVRCLESVGATEHNREPFLDTVGISMWAFWRPGHRPTVPWVTE